MCGGNWKEMFAAACDGNLDLVTYHVKNGVDINYVHPEFLSTPLVATILAKQEKVALYLLESGANPHMLSEFDGLRPIQAAQQTGLKATQARLLELGAVPPEPVVSPKSWLNRIFKSM
jgi:ankyrin repeat protein